VFGGVEVGVVKETKINTRKIPGLLPMFVNVSYVHYRGKLFLLDYNMKLSN
jgi:hypothetical protein